MFAKYKQIYMIHYYMEGITIWHFMVFVKEQLRANIDPGIKVNCPLSWCMCGMASLPGYKIIPIHSIFGTDLNYPFFYYIIIVDFRKKFSTIFDTNFSDKMDR